MKDCFITDQAYCRESLLTSYKLGSKSYSVVEFETDRLMDILVQNAFRDSFGLIGDNNLGRDFSTHLFMVELILANFC